MFYIFKRKQSPKVIFNWSKNEIKKRNKSNESLVACFQCEIFIRFIIIIMITSEKIYFFGCIVGLLCQVKDVKDEGKKKWKSNTHSHIYTPSMWDAGVDDHKEKNTSRLCRAVFFPLPILFLNVFHWESNKKSSTQQREYPSCLLYEIIIKSQWIGKN